MSRLVRISPWLALFLLSLIAGIALATRGRHPLVTRSSSPATAVANPATRPLAANEKAQYETGRQYFAKICTACHQPDGQGLPGLAPSLVNSRWVQDDPRILARIVLNGFGQENLVMPPWKQVLNDEAIASVLTFIRKSWGHDADSVSPAIVAEARRETATRELPLSDYDLETLVLTLPPLPK